MAEKAPAAGPEGINKSKLRKLGEGFGAIVSTAFGNFFRPIGNFFGNIWRDFVGSAKSAFK